MGRLDARQAVASRFDGWADALTNLIRGGTGGAVVRPIYALPVDHRWAPRDGMTLVGDAAHLMSPFAGEGANLAMLDGAELAEAILDHPFDLTVALARYEGALFPRSRTSAEQAAGNLAKLFGSEAPRSVVALFDR